MLGIMTSRLNIVVIDNRASGDHQARIIVDDVDWLGGDYLGLDPPELASQFASPGAERLIVGRCACGCAACDDVVVEVRRTDDQTEWSKVGCCISFDNEQYDTELERFSLDRTWETVGRQVEREVGSIFERAITADGLSFDWASTRFRPSPLNMVSLSFSKGGEQRVIEFNWDGATLQSALDGAGSLYDEQFRRD